MEPDHPSARAYSTDEGQPGLVSASGLRQRALPRTSIIHLMFGLSAQTEEAGTGSAGALRLGHVVGS